MTEPDVDAEDRDGMPRPGEESEHRVDNDDGAPRERAGDRDARYVTV